ncbi:MAG: YfhO family protein [Cytophagaceae bacterium]|nr:YfhO family protein [Cytophagaceae bacterium]
MKLNEFLKSLVPHLIASAVFIVILCIYFSPVFEGRKLAQSDVIQSIGSLKESLEYEKNTGEEILWSNSSFGGMAVWRGYKKNIITHFHYFITESIPSPILICFLFFIGFYILLLTFRVNVYLSFIGSAAYTFASFNIVSLEVGHINKLYDMALSAPILAGAVLAYQKRYWLGAGVTALFTSLQIFYGHVQITYYLLILILFFVVAQLIVSIKEKTLPHFIKASAILLIAALIGVAPNISKLWTTAEYSKATTRGGSELLTQKTEGDGLDKDYAFQWSNGLMESFTLYIPYFYGGASKESLGKSSEVYKVIAKKTSNKQAAKEYSNNVPGYWGEQPMTSGPVYVGAIVCFLFVLGLFLIKGSTKWWILSISILAIMLSWGRNFMPLSELFFNYFPLYNKFRSVTMIQCIVQVTFGLFAFLTLKEIVQGTLEKDRILFGLKWSTIIMGGIALFFALCGTMLFDFTSEANDEAVIKQLPDWLWEAIIEDRKSIFRGDAFRSFFLVIITAGIIWALVTDKIKKELFYGVLALLVLFDMVVVARRYLGKESFSIKKNYEKEVYISTSADDVILRDKDPYFRVFNTTTGLTGDAVTSYFHKSLGGYSAIKLRRYQDVIDSALYKFNREVINMLNTKYFIQKDSLNNYYAIPNPGALGNAWFVNEYQFVKNADEEIVKLQNFNPATTAIVDDDFKQYLEGKTFTKDSSANIKLTEYHPNRLKFKSVSSTPQLAVFSDIYYQPGWNAYVDGKLTPHFRVDYILRSMVIPNGEHTIEFKFEPESYFISEKISFIGSIVLVVFLIGVTGLLIFKNKENTHVA